MPAGGNELQVKCGINEEKGNSEQDWKTPCKSRSVPINATSDE